MNTFGLAESVSSWYGMLIMAVIGLMSVYLFALIMLRALFYRRIATGGQQLVEETRRALEAKDEPKLKELKRHNAADAPLRILVGTGLAHMGLKEDEQAELFRLTRKKQKTRLDKGLSAFGTLATIAPFVGLLGTVMGIIESFHNLALSGAAGPNVVGSGVAAALWATAAGLCVAIPAVVAYNVFSNKGKAILLEMEVASSELALLFKAAGRRALGLNSVKGAANG